MKIEKVVVGPLSTNCYIVFIKNEAIIIDPGDEAEKILKVIEKIKVKPKYIILTHYHFDHLLAAQELREKTKAKILSESIVEEILITFPSFLISFSG